MVGEDYCSFEVAKLLKEKGFIGECERRYSLIDTRDWQGDIRVELSTGESYSSQIIYIKESIQCPTHQMAMKWLREVHNVFIDITSRFSLNADRDVCFSYSCKKLIDTYKSSYEVGDGEWLNYEEASEAAIKYCLENLI